MFLFFMVLYAGLWINLRFRYQKFIYDNKRSVLSLDYCLLYLILSKTMKANLWNERLKSFKNLLINCSSTLIQSERHDEIKWNIFTSYPRMKVNFIKFYSLCGIRHQHIINEILCLWTEMIGHHIIGLYYFKLFKVPLIFLNKSAITSSSNGK